MKKLLVLFIALLYISAAYSQNTFKAVIKDAATNLPLTGASLALLGTNIGGIADTTGLITLNNIPNGKQIVQYRHIGYIIRQDTLIFPLVQVQPQMIL